MSVVSANFLTALVYLFLTLRTALIILPMFRYQMKAAGKRITGIAMKIAIMNSICIILVSILALYFHLTIHPL